MKKLKNYCIMNRYIDFFLSNYQTFKILFQKTYHNTNILGIIL